MEMYIDSILRDIQTYDWNSPFTFVLVGIVLLFFMRKWAMLLLTLATIVIAYLGTDLIIWNIEHDQEVVRVPLAVYIAGGIIIGILSVVSFTKYSID